MATPLPPRRRAGTTPPPPPAAAPPAPGMLARRPVLAPALLLFAIMTSHALLETARDALFLAELGPDKLAWAYLAIAGVALLAVGAVRRWGGLREPRSMLISFLIAAAIGTATLAATITRTASLTFVLYVWTGLVATLVVPSFWMVIDRSLSVAEAKRMFGAIGAGGVVGALVGSALATALGRLVEPHHLVTVGAFGFTAAALSAVWLAPRSIHAAEPTRRRYLDIEREHAASQRSLRHVRLLILLGLVSTITLTFGDMMFKRMLAERMAEHDFTSVFGAIYTGLNLLGLVVQLAVTPRLFDRLGVGAALTVLPMLLVVSAVGFVLTGAAVAILALKLSDGGLRYSVHRVASEILFLPLTSAVRDAAKPAIDAIGQRGGQALAALLTVAVASGAAGTWTLAVMTAGAAAVWLAVIVVVRGSYVQLFRDTLQAGEILRDATVPQLDNDSVQLLTASLSSPDEAEALASLDLLAGRGTQIPALVLYHPSIAVVRRALSLLEGAVRPDIQRVLGHLTTHSDPQIRAAALAASSRTGCNSATLLAALGDPEPDVRAAAVVGLLDCDAPAPEASAELAQLLEASTTTRAALAHAVGRAPGERFRALLDQLAARREPEVVREVLAVWTRAPQLADVERLMMLLEVPRVRGDVRKVFTASGHDHLGRLIDALDDPRTPLGVRRHLPRTISRYNTPSAAAALVARLPREPDGTTEFKILRALGRMRANDPTLLLDPSPIRDYIRRAIGDAIRYDRLAVRLSTEPQNDSPSAELLAELLAEKQRHAIERVFRALGILSPHAGMRSVHDAITSDDPARRSAAQEILEDQVSPDLRLPLLDLIQGGDPTLSQAIAPFPTYADLIGALLVDPSDSLRCVAAHHVAERHLVGLRDELVRLRPVISSPMVVHAFDQALEQLDA